MLFHKYNSFLDDMAVKRLQRIEKDSMDWHKKMKRFVNGKKDETTKIPISFCNGFATCKITLSIAIYKIGLEKSFDYNIVKRGIIMSIEIRWVGEG